jgi:hypothetical protein
MELLYALSPSDTSEGSGATREPQALQYLESETEPNPTVVTLTRYAQALGKNLVVSPD